MRFVDDEYLFLSRTGRHSPGAQARQARTVERRVRAVQFAAAITAAKARHPPSPLVVRLPVRRAVHFVPRRDA